MRNAFFHAFFFTFFNQIIWQKNDWFASSLEESCFSWLTLKHCNEWISLQSSIIQKVIITRSTVFHHPQGMRGCHNNGDIMAGCHYEVSTWQGVPTNCSECLPQLDIRDTDRREGNGKTPRVGKRGEREEDREKKVRGGIWRGRKGGGDKWEERRWRVAGWKRKMRRKRDWRGRVQWLEYDGLCRPCRTRLCVCVCACVSALGGFELMRISDERRGSSWPACKWHQTHMWKHPLICAHILTHPQYLPHTTHFQMQIIHTRKCMRQYKKGIFSLSFWHRHNLSHRFCLVFRHGMHQYVTVWVASGSTDALPAVLHDTMSFISEFSKYVENLRLLPITQESASHTDRQTIFVYLWKRLTVHMFQENCQEQDTCRNY